MRTISFTQKAFEEYNYWRSVDRKMQDKIIELIEDILRNPFTGVGKPEPLKHLLKGFWSRRISQEHRLVYEVTETSINIISCRDHY
ncbi:MAG: Txe/YoeB family addiction module toxin [Flavisolibacter sp.]|nr:Txe/YoeB family addiction module toxin [Flavisolibacter sp.]MBD0284218.1 Txe/YoeB family addiction module toxin [Flavisolibacter sp.]